MRPFCQIASTTCLIGPDGYKCDDNQHMCELNLRTKILIFAVLKRRLLRLRETESTFVFVGLVWKKYIWYKAIVDYTSPALCTPVTPFPPIGDAAYRQLAGGGPSHRHGRHAQKLVKIARVVPEISCRTDRLTDRHTDRRTHHNTYTSQPLPRAK